MIFHRARPTLGWLVYLIVGKSWFRMCAMLLLLGYATLTLLRRSQESLILNYIRPSHFPPPLIILTLPNQNSLTPFDACAIEAAASRAPVPRNYNFPKKSTPVYVYMWTPHVGQTDTWTRAVKDLPGITLAYLDWNKVLKNTPLQGKFPSYSWSYTPNWIEWIASGGSLLWNSGGILIPSGVLLTTPLYLDMVEKNTGLLVVGKSRIRHVAFGAKMNHKLIKTVLEYIPNIDFVDYTEEMTVANQTGEFEQLNDLLTLAVVESCDLENLELLHDADQCAEFTKINASEIWKFSFQTPVSERKLEDYSFIQFIGNSDIMLTNLRGTNRLFHKHGLQKFCPIVHKKLEKEILEVL